MVISSNRRLIACTGLIATSACGGLCANTITSRTTSPNGDRDAVVFTRDCGATTAYSTQVTLTPAGAKVPNQAGDVFVVPDSTDVRLEWLGSDTLLIRYRRTNPYLKADQVKGVTIRYLSLP